MSKRPQDTAFRQQRQAAWKPMLTPINIVSCFTAVAAACLAAGTALALRSDGVVQAKVQYDGRGSSKAYNDCAVGNFGEHQTCRLKVTAPKRMDAPIFVYYELSAFFQNHRRYANSINHDQIMGVEKDKDEISSCEPLKFNGSLVLSPCGLRANSLFDDVFSLPPSSRFELEASGMTHAKANKLRFKQPSTFDFKVVADANCTAKERCDDEVCSEHAIKAPCFGYTCVGGDFDGQKCAAGDQALFYYPKADQMQYLHQTYPAIVSPLVGVESERFQVWMENAALPNFRKPYARLRFIDGPQHVRKGETLEFEVDARFWVSGFGGRKWLVLAQADRQATANGFLGAAFITTAAVCAGLAVFFAWLASHEQRKLADLSLLRKE
ncbi:CDC50/LEM3 family [Pelagophyceae sp. CCMP2097]|nr:CDC50/LEM3 family [Pelagophyceae sp. CCMP2097]